MYTIHPRAMSNEVYGTLLLLPYHCFSFIYKKNIIRIQRSSKQPNLLFVKGKKKEYIRGGLKYGCLKESNLMTKK